jgi:hypothetical protein
MSFIKQEHDTASIEKLTEQIAESTLTVDTVNTMNTDNLRSPPGRFECETEEIKHPETQ